MDVAYSGFVFHKKVSDHNDLGGKKDKWGKKKAPDLTLNIKWIRDLKTFKN